MMTNIEERITQMASCGLSPYVIEERLGMEHYTIHIKYHQALMNGYVTAPASGRVHTLTAEEKAERKRQRAKERLVEYKRATYEQRKDKINERRRELRRIKKEQANAKKQEAAQGVQAPSDSENRLLLPA